MYRDNERKYVKILDDIGLCYWMWKISENWEVLDVQRRRTDIFSASVDRLIGKIAQSYQYTALSNRPFYKPDQRFKAGSDSNGLVLYCNFRSMLNVNSMSSQTPAPAGVNSWYYYRPWDPDAASSPLATEFDRQGSTPLSLCIVSSQTNPTPRIAWANQQAWVNTPPHLNNIDYTSFTIHYSYIMELK